MAGFSNKRQKTTTTEEYPGFHFGV